MIQQDLHRRGVHIINKENCLETSWVERSSSLKLRFIQSLCPGQCDNTLDHIEITTTSGHMSSWWATTFSPMCTIPNKTCCLVPLFEDARLRKHYWQDQGVQHCNLLGMLHSSTYNIQLIKYACFQGGGGPERACQDHFRQTGHLHCICHLGIGVVVCLIGITLKYHQA